MSLKTFFSEIINAYDFKQLSNRFTNPREKIRLLAFAHIQDGASVQEATKAVKLSRNAREDLVGKVRNDHWTG